MRGDERGPLGRRNYEQFAERYAEAVATKPHNAYYDRPAVLGLVGDVAGKRVLDAGCGPGVYAEELVNRGAMVTAVDVTPEFVEIARKRLGERAEVLEWNLETPLRFARDGEFDAVLSALVLDYIEDWTAVFSEFRRVLRPGGALVFSAGHPWSDWRMVSEQGLVRGAYFDTEQFTMEWHGFGEPYPTVTGFRRPLGAIANAVVDAGLRLERVVEPRPTEEFRQANPEGYERLMREPIFICIRAVKAESGA